MPETTVLLCRCATHTCLDQADVCALHQALEPLDDIDLRVVDDLCGLAEKKRLEKTGIGKHDHVVACFPRAVRWLLNDSSENSDQQHTQFHNLRENSADEILLKLKLPLPASTGIPPGSDTGDDRPPEWPPWYPVIDYDRCTHCGQCLSFCLFNVFDKDEQNDVVVAAPRNCKDNCPACARICPEVAIMFPKTDSAPINGDEIQDELLEREKALIALQQSSGANLHAFLSNRNRNAGKGLLKPEARKRIFGDR
ncbi:hypothetical protein BVX99_02835 [bacterium F16]|nr:hypothetical protein BVX99_02835 [bacterium F16]